MGIVVQGNPNWVQGSSYLGYDNIFLRTGAVVSASAADANFPETNATSWLITGGGWRATVTPEVNITASLLVTENANSYAIFKHNLGDLAATIKLQYSADGAVWTDFPASTKNVADNKAIFFVSDTPVSAAWWRLNITNIPAAATVIIGQTFISNSLRMYSPPEPGFTPPDLALNNEYISSRADGGDFLGRTLIRRGSKMSFNNSIVPKIWIRDNWQDVMVAIEKTPFYYGWDTSNYPAEVAYCYVPKKIAIPSYINSNFFSLNLSFIALVE